MTDTSETQVNLFIEKLHVESNVLTSNSRVNVNFRASAADDNGNLQPLAWHVRQINAELFFAGAGFMPSQSPNDNTPYRAVMFVVRMGCGGGEE